jgi:hypothetical protein
VLPVQVYRTFWGLWGVLSKEFFLRDIYFMRHAQGTHENSPSFLSDFNEKSKVSLNLNGISLYKFL